MATLTDQTIGSTYPLLLKVEDTGIQAFASGLKYVQDGAATNSTLKIATDAISINAGHKLHLDGGGDTYLWQASPNLVELFAGNSKAFSANATTTIFNEESADRDFRIESNGQANMFFVDGGSDKIGIGKVAVDGILEVKGQTASSPVISVDGSAPNGFIMMSDNYVAGEAQYSTGVTQSGAATYIANRVHTATGQAYTHADGWKSSTDVDDYRGAAIVVDGNAASAGGGSISLYYGHSEGTVTTGSTKALTRGFILDYTGKVGIGTSSPDATLHVAGSFAAAGPSETFQTFSGTDTNPSVANGNLFKTHASGQTLTTFDDGVNGQIITVISTAAVVFAVSGNLQAGTTNITTASGDVTQWVYDGTNWYLLSWMDDSIDLSSGGF